MPPENSENLAPAANERASLAEALRRLDGRFAGRLAGARQATRSHLVRYLASALRIAEQSAERIFDRLQQLGIIQRIDSAKSDTHEYGASQHWHICNDDQAQIKLQEIGDSEIDVLANDSREAFAAAEELLRRAIAARATDIHLDPYADEVEVRFRIDGRLEHYCRLSDLIAARTIAQLKLMAELDVAEPFEPQEGHLELPIEFDLYAGRVTVVPVAGGEAVAVRLLHRDRLVRPLDALGFSSEQREQVHKLLNSSEGIVLVSGPTGSGKTTTLYSLLHGLDDGHRNIVTIEDPIEFRIPAFLQIEVDEKHNVTMPRALKTVLRMDPDVIMLGELRDEDATALSMRAADTGTYVFGTVHARDAASVITAMRDQRADLRSLAANLRAMISQRLVRRLCEGCAEWRPITSDAKAKYLDAGLEPPNQVKYPVGCSSCQGTGYFERIGVFEIAEVTDEIEEAIKGGAPENVIRRILRKTGVCSHIVDGLEKARLGVTSVEEVCHIRWGELRRQRESALEGAPEMESTNDQEV
jgi:type II secretory ATPase GspE/PulE/Tfp pilus assembly ATPase PilB-like protein